MRKSLTVLAVIATASLTLGMCSTPAHAAVLPTVSATVTCNPSGTRGTMWAQFEYDSAGNRKPRRGGWNGDSKWNVKAINVIGYVGGNGYRDPAITFGSAQKNASQYVPATAPVAPRSQVSIGVYLTFTDGTKCAAGFPSN